jgi:hypothetical protein
MTRILLTLIVFLSAGTVGAGETVFVRPRGFIDLDPFACTKIPISTIMKRVCYDEQNKYLLIEIGDVFYHYCEVSNQVVSALVRAPSVASYYNSKIRSGPYNCKSKRMPIYEER